MKKITQGLYPSSSGWSFVEQGTTLTAPSFIELVTKVAEFRRRNNFPAGDALAEVTSYICERNPGICKDGVRSVPSPLPAGATFGDRVLSWISQEAASPAAKPADPERILQRAEACRACPLNVQFEATCTSCNKSPLKFENAVAASNPAGANTGLGGCRHYHWSNKMAIRKTLAPDSRAPAGCWRRPQG